MNFGSKVQFRNETVSNITWASLSGRRSSGVASLDFLAFFLTFATTQLFKLTRRETSAWGAGMWSHDGGSEFKTTMARALI